MFSLCRPLYDYGVDRHYKIGKALNAIIKTDCMYPHPRYINEEKFPQWVYFVVQQDVESFPPIKEFLGPLINTLSGDKFASDESGEFSKQSFAVQWEGK